jgi:CRISPR/Cas system-associated exonuclease Cas4 (RecB family)
MKNIYVFLLALFISLGTQSQVQDGGGQELMLLKTKANEDLKKVKGSPYLNEDFTQGKAFITGKEPLNVFLRYEVAKDIIEIKTDKGSPETYILPLGQKAEYKIDNNLFVLENLNFSGNRINGYFVEHFKGENIRLLQKFTASFSEAVIAKTGYEKDRPAEITIDNHFYMVSKNGEVQPIELKERELKKAFSGSKEVESYLSSNKLKSVEDFVKFFQWYDTQL